MRLDCINSGVCRAPWGLALTLPCVVSVVTDAVPSVLYSDFCLLCSYGHICGLFKVPCSWTTNPRHGVSPWDATVGSNGGLILADPRSGLRFLREPQNRNGYATTSCSG
jgi:hypothetical protein